MSKQIQGKLELDKQGNHRFQDKSEAEFSSLSELCVKMIKHKNGW